jgi:diguanylate cyclase (GGDEF)-like protein
VVGQPLEQSLTPASARAAREGLQRIVHALNSGTPVGQIPPLELEHTCKDRDSVWTEATISVMHDSDGRFVGVLGVTRDISERRQAQQRMVYLAQHDPLTGLPNRTLLDDRIRQALGHARRAGKQVALMFLDLDNFKPINDLHGHAAGDVVLQQAARRISDCLRSTDTVARIGGDEFVVLLTEVDQASAALAVAEKIRESLARPFEVQGLCHEVSCSIGIALYPEHGPGALELSRHADAAMYQAKARGRNQVMLYERPLAMGTAQVPRT